MITSVDSSVLIDILNADPKYGDTSRRALNLALDRGSVIACEIVWAEVCGTFSPAERVAEALRTFGVEFDPTDVTAAIKAGEAWKTYRRRGGKRVKMIPDFIIGAHALGRADRLLTRDRGFYRSYFKDLDVANPSKR